MRNLNFSIGRAFRRRIPEKLTGFAYLAVIALGAAMAGGVFRTTNSELLFPAAIGAFIILFLIVVKRLFRSHWPSYR